MFSKKTTIFIGHFGSGKTEISVNYAMQLKQTQDKVAILDLDIVNPFFRTADVKEKLEDAGVRVVLPLYANTNVDIPALTNEFLSVIKQEDMYSIIDVGGDDLGAKVVSRFKKDLVNRDIDLFFVINPFRPMTDSMEKILTMYEEITESAGIRPTGLVNNANLLENTTSEIIEEGHKMVTEVSKRLSIPIAFAAGALEALEKADLATTKKLYLDKQILLPWVRN